ncbi:PfkB family carbohydrate kinase [Aurantimonas marina]|uniref:PfkB family carbohydrate kinase n=1 Tax=Aurantimonas marina TaxID=2780508 RepID=UPI002FCDC410
MSDGAPQRPAEMHRAIEAAASAATICLPSFPDVEAAFDDASPAATAERYLGLGAGEVVVKDGRDPALVAYADKRQDVAAETVTQPLDTTGAGDSFSAAYLAARLSGLPPVEAARKGHALAAQVVRHYGALMR